MKRICVFCKNKLKFPIFSENRLSIYNRYGCENCQFPNYKTYYMQYYKVILAEQILYAENIAIDKFFITKNYNSNTTFIYNDVIGTYGDYIDPISIKDPICKLNYIIDISFEKLNDTLEKLDTWMLFV